jgi:hypothetical protein
MAKILIIYSTDDSLSLPPNQFLKTHAWGAEMRLKDGMESSDVYAIARKLAEMLLEQLP